MDVNTFFVVWSFFCVSYSYISIRGGGVRQASLSYLTYNDWQSSILQLMMNKQHVPTFSHNRQRYGVEPNIMNRFVHSYRWKHSDTREYYVDKLNLFWIYIEKSVCWKLKDTGVKQYQIASHVFLVGVSFLCLVWNW